MHKYPEWTIQAKRSQSIKQASDIGPGDYEEHRQFGYDKRNFTIGNNRQLSPQKKIGPGFYSPERSIIEFRNPQWQWSSNSGRKYQEIETCNGPGTYNENTKFGDKSISYTIGVRRQEKSSEGPGPGYYQYEESDTQTMPRNNQALEWKNNTGRTVTVLDPNRGPGSYVDGRNFGDDTISYPIGIRRQEKIYEAPGPGYYKHEEADNFTKPRNNYALEWKNNTGRIDTVIDPNGGPGTYDDGRNFGDNVKVLPFGVLREEKIPVGPGPGHYQHEDADKLTMPRNNIGLEWKNNTGRIDNQIDPIGGPGSYDDGRKFGDDVKVQAFGIRREEKISQGPGPGHYQHQDADSLTMPRNNIGLEWKNNTGRIDNQIDSNGGPGSYDDGRNFGDDAKVQAFGIRREEKIPLGPGPGHYQHQDADSLTMPRNNVGLEWKNNTGRIDNQINPNGGPGSYDDGRNFGDDAKVQAFGIRREEKIPLGPGPGHYQHQDADLLTMPRNNVGLEWKNNTGRIDNQINPNGGPGSYDDGRNFGDDAKVQAFGIRREEKIPLGPGPGHYQHQDADLLTMPRNNVGLEWKNNTGRIDNQINPNGGPGSYDDGRNFGDDAKVQAFGIRREEKIPLGPGPGHYQHQDADLLTMPRNNVGLEWKNNTGRIDNKIDPNGGPGSYDDGRNFGDDAKVQAFGIRREEKIPLGPGPGHYQHQDADSLTMPRNNVGLEWKNNTGRIETVIDPNGGPGSYDVLRNFGDDVKVQPFGVRREEKIPLGPGPGYYQHDDADQLTKPRNNIGVEWKNNTGRIETVIDPTGGPGSYDDGRNFGDDVKVLPFGVRREEKIPLGPGPGHYQHEDADQLTMPRNNIGVEWKNNTGRIETVIDPTGGPGSYDDGRNFGDDVKVLPFGVRREEKIPQGPGPGHYQHEDADQLTMPRTNIGVEWKNNTGRIETVMDPTGGPGSYDDGRNFGGDVKVLPFGVRREEKIPQGPGPGHYQHEDADQLTMPRNNIGVEWKNNTGRIETVIDPTGGPGSYDDGRNFGDGVKVLPFGARREEKIPLGPGPGHYQHEDADQLTMPRNNIGVEWKNNTGRIETVVDPNGGPGSYNDNKNFGDDVKVLPFGIRREEKISQGPGPGHYQHEDADSLTMPRNNIGLEWKNNTGRIDTVIDSNGGPGSYDVKLNEVKVLTIGIRREEKISDGPGPGSYQHELADLHVKPRIKQASFDKTSPRKSMDIQPNLGPGTYEFQTSIHHNQGYTIQQKRDYKIDQSPGPCDYDNEKFTALTKPSSRAIDFKNILSRTDSQIITPDLGPGFYDVLKSFGKSSSKMTIGMRRTSKSPDGPAPGQYNPERADKFTKTEQPKFNFSKIQGRPQSAIDPNIGPGSYMNITDFAKDLGHITIGKKQDVMIEPSPGPGYYDKERADTVVHKSSKKIDFSKSPMRTREKSDFGGPGFYDFNSHFAINSKAFSIGVKRPESIKKTIGPGHYNAAKAIECTKSSSLAVNFANKSKRVENSFDPTKGPGSYIKNTNTFGNNLKSHTIGVKRITKVDQNPGPGHYNPETHDLKIKQTKVLSIDFTNSPGRNHIDQNINLGPGEYDILSKTSSKQFTIGEKRLIKQDITPGPGQYDHERADNLTRCSSQVKDFAKTSNYKWEQVYPSNFSVSPSKSFVSPNKTNKGLKQSQTMRDIITSQNLDRLASTKTELSIFNESANKYKVFKNIPGSTKKATQQGKTTVKHNQNNQMKVQYEDRVQAAGILNQKQYTAYKNVGISKRKQTSPMKPKY